MERDYSVIVGKSCLYCTASDTLLVRLLNVHTLGLIYCFAMSIKILQVSGTKVLLL